MRWKPGRPCLEVASVTTSCSSGKANRAANTLDRDLRTRWTAAGSGKQWVLYDLGAVKGVASASIVWYAPRKTRTAFSVEVSVDGRQFAQVDAGLLAGRGTSTSLRSFMPVEARYVRVTLDLAADAVVPSVYEVAIHAGGADQAVTAAR
jgi:hypothetical protein